MVRVLAGEGVSLPLSLSATNPATGARRGFFSTLFLLVASRVVETLRSLRDRLGDRAGKNPELTNNGRRSWEPIVTGRMPPEEDLWVGLAGLLPAAFELEVLCSSWDDSEPPWELWED